MSKASEALERKQREEDYAKAQKYFVWNDSSIAFRVLIRPVYKSDPDWARRVLALRPKPLLLSPWIEPHEIPDAYALLEKYGVKSDEPE